MKSVDGKRGSTLYVGANYKIHRINFYLVHVNIIYRMFITDFLSNELYKKNYKIS